MILCFFGDSLTLGYGDPAGLGWPGRVSGALHNGGRDVTAYNLGIRRDSSMLIAGRWREEADRRAIEGDPLKLVFSFGVADMTNGVPRDETLAAAEALLTEARGLGDVLVVGPPPVLDEAKCARVADLSRAIAALCDFLGVPFVPTMDGLLADPIYIQALADGDTVHPTAAGYAAMARLILAAPEAAAFFELED
ncbi:MAG: GDSL-type esterase/lipase family protein [Pseudodesulfovibrio sp.]